VVAAAWAKEAAQEADSITPAVAMGAVHIGMAQGADSITITTDASTAGSSSERHSGIPTIHLRITTTTARLRIITARITGSLNTRRRRCMSRNLKGRRHPRRRVKFSARIAERITRTFRIVPLGGSACSERPKRWHRLDRAETEPSSACRSCFPPRSNARHACAFLTRLVAALLVLGVLVSSCVHVGATITSTPTIPDCIPGSATKPCQ
jgi:hypothetical protein